MAKLWARPVHGVLILAKEGGGGAGPLPPMLDPPLCTCMLSVYSVRLCALHCFYDCVCMHFLLDQFF